MCFGALTITNLGIENLNHYKKTILEIHSSEVRGHSCLVGEWHGGTRKVCFLSEKERGYNPPAFPRPGSGGWCPTSST